MTLEGLPDVEGSGGGKGGGGNTPIEMPNSLQSNAKAMTVDLISEGPIKGLVDGMNTVYFNDTPWGYRDGGGAQQSNFQGVSFALNTGTPDQLPLGGFPAVETTYAVGAQVKNSQPVVRQISSPNADHVRVTIQIPTLLSQDVSSGSVNETIVQLQIDVQPNGGAYQTAIADSIIGKTTSVFARDYTVALPAGGFPWNVRVQRVSPDSTTTTLANDIYFATYTEIVSQQLSYANRAVAGCIFDAQTFGTTVPTRSWLIDGRLIKIPSNYDPYARSYSGIWDGTFKTDWTNNPAWVFYDLLTHPRYGMGNVIAEDQVDKWALYAIAQYCDGQVPNGFGGGTEPRFTFNMQITSRQDAYQALQMIASCFNGMVYWGAGRVVTIADMPSTSVAAVLTNANVKEGKFVYSGAALSSYHTVAQVTWNDPANSYKPTVEVVIDDAGVLKWGERQSQIYAYGCTSRGQARRMGKWMLDTERTQGETMSCVVPLDQMADVRPGDLIAVADRDYAGISLAGRVLNVTQGGLMVQVDNLITLQPGFAYTLRINLPDGSWQERTVDTVTTTNFATIRVWVTAPFSITPQGNAIWMLYSTYVEPRQFRVITVAEQSGGEFTISAVFHDPNKYLRIEQDINVEDPNYTAYPTGPLPAPVGMTYKEFLYRSGADGQVHSGVLISWQHSNDARVDTYELQYLPPGALSYLFSQYTSSPSGEVRDTYEGYWSFRVRALSAIAAPSPWAYLENISLGALHIRPDDVTGFDVWLTGTIATFVWNPVPQEEFCTYTIRWTSDNVFPTWETSILIADGIVGDSYQMGARDGTFFIKAVTLFGVESLNAAMLETNMASVSAINVVYSVSEDPTWPGTRSNLTLTPGLGLKVSTGTSGTYTTGIIDIGANFLVHMNLAMVAYGIRPDDYMIAWKRLSDVRALATGASTAWQAKVLVRTTGDNPSSPTASWTPWQTFFTSDISGRGFQFMVELDSLDGGTTLPEMFKLKFIIDVPDRVAGNHAVTVPSGGLNVVFDKRFYDTPTIGVTGRNMVSGDYWAITNQAPTGFTVRFFDHFDNGVARVMDWMAKGYGAGT